MNEQIFALWAKLNWPMGVYSLLPAADLVRGRNWSRLQKKGLTMSNSGVHTVSAADVSGALRYDRIARLEAVLKLKEKRKAQRFAMLLVLGCVGAMAAIAFTW